MNATPNDQADVKTAESGTNSESAPAKQRSTLEKIIIRGLIFVLVVFAAVEARARFGFQFTQDAVTEAFDEKADWELTELESKFWFMPSRVSEVDRDRNSLKLTWFSFIHKDTYEIRLAMNKDKTIAESFMVPEGARPDRTMTLANASGEPDPEDTGLAAEGLRKAPKKKAKKKRGGRKIDPQAFISRLMENDKNKDGKLSKDEWPEGRGSRLCEAADEDKDGVVTKEQLEKALQQFRSRGKKKRDERSNNEGAVKKEKKEPAPAETKDAKSAKEPATKDARKTESGTKPKDKE